MLTCSVNISMPECKVNGNGTVYTKEAVNAAMIEYMDKVSKEDVSFGWFMDSDRSKENVTHIVDRIREDNGQWFADITLMDTSRGTVAQMIFDLKGVEVVPNLEVHDDDFTRISVKSIDISLKKL